MAKRKPRHARPQKTERRDELPTTKEHGKAAAGGPVGMLGGAQGTDLTNGNYRASPERTLA